ncbi:hypothetical protein D3C72_1753020 [compost metagenome]
MPSAPPMMNDAARLITVLKRPFTICQPSQPETAKASAVKKNFCQPPASARKLNAAPGLYSRVKPK